MNDPSEIANQNENESSDICNKNVIHEDQNLIDNKGSLSDIEIKGEEADIKSRQSHIKTNEELVVHFSEFGKQDGIADENNPRNWALVRNLPK